MTLKNLILLAFLSIATAAEAAQPLHPAVTQDPISLDAEHPPGIVEMNFQSHGSRLNGLVYTANGPGPHPTVVLLHGMPGNEKNLDLAQSLRRGGFNVLFFHYRGAWGSEGSWSLGHQVEDAASATKALRERAGDYRVDPGRIIFVGHSVGGFVAIKAASNDPSIRCVAGIASANPAVWAPAFEEYPEAAAGFAAYVDDLQMLSGVSGKSLVEEVIDQAGPFDLTALAPSLSGKTVLLIAGEQDAVLEPAVHHAPMVAAYQDQADIQLTHQVLSGDHSFSWSRQRLMSEVLNWIEGCR